MPEPTTTASFLGLKYATMIAGFAGGIVSLSYVRELTRAQAGMAVIAGMFCANYGTPVAVQYIGLDAAMENGVAFLLGLCAINIVPGVLRISERWRDNPSLGKGGKP